MSNSNDTWNEWSIDTFAMLRKHFLAVKDDEAFRLLVSLEDRKGIIPFSAGADIATALLLRYYRPELRSTTLKTKDAVDKTTKKE